MARTKQIRKCRPQKAIPQSAPFNFTALPIEIRFMILALLPPSAALNLGSCNVLMYVEVMPELFKRTLWVRVPAEPQNSVHKHAQGYVRQIIYPSTIASRYDLLSLTKWTILQRNYPRMSSVMIPIYDSEFRTYSASFVEMLAIMARFLGIEFWIQVCGDTVFRVSERLCYREVRYFKVDFETKKLFAVDCHGRILKSPNLRDSEIETVMAVDATGNVITEPPKDFVRPKAPLNETYYFQTWKAIDHLQVYPICILVATT
jgi:hypothetical protein